MKLVFDKSDMIEFVKWHDGKLEADCNKTFDEELDEWLMIQNKSSNSDYAKCSNELLKYITDNICNDEVSKKEIRAIFKRCRNTSFFLFFVDK